MSLLFSDVDSVLSICRSTGGSDIPHSLHIVMEIDSYKFSRVLVLGILSPLVLKSLRQIKLQNVFLEQSSLDGAEH